MCVCVGEGGVDEKKSNCQLETWYAVSGTQVLLIMFKLLP